MVKKNKLSKTDQKLLKEARELVELFKSKGYQEYLKSFLFNLAQEGYPQPSKYKKKEELILAYTEKCGETNAVKRIMGYIEGAQETIDNINKKLDDQREYEIGT